MWMRVLCSLPTMRVGRTMPRLASRFRPSMKSLRRLILCWSIFSSCKVYQDVKIEKVRQLQFEEFDNNGIQGTLKVTIENPNWYALEITAADIDLGLQGRKVARVHLSESVTVPKRSKNEYLLNWCCTFLSC